LTSGDAAPQAIAADQRLLGVAQARAPVCRMRRTFAGGFVALAAKLAVADR